MTHVLLVHNNDTQEVDLALDSRGFISLEAGLETMALISLFTNKRARPSDGEQEQPYGWWADTYAETPGDEIGSHLWLLRRAGLTLQTIRKARVFSEQAFAWMLKLGIAKKIEITTERFEDDTIAIQTRFHRPNADPWEALWRVHVNGV